MNVAVTEAPEACPPAQSVSRRFSDQEAFCPPLENGDRLTRKEFERRYEAMPQLKKAELIEGIVYMGSPVRIKSHSKPHGMILGWLAAYSAARLGTDFGDNGSLRLDPDNEPQPDAYLRIEAEAGGRSQIDAEDYLAAAPELIVEVAASSASIDTRDKRHVYRRNGIQEYVVWRVLEKAVDWWELVEGEYQPLRRAARKASWRAKRSPACAWPWHRCWRWTSEPSWTNSKRACNPRPISFSRPIWPPE